MDFKTFSNEYTKIVKQKRLNLNCRPIWLQYCYDISPEYHIGMLEHVNACEPNHNALLIEEKYNTKE